MPKRKKVTKSRNRAAQDATLINVRSMKKRVAELETRVARLETAARGVATLPPIGLPPEG